MIVGNITYYCWKDWGLQVSEYVSFYSYCILGKAKLLLFFFISCTLLYITVVKTYVSE